jgi:hypothetical protein
VASLDVSVVAVGPGCKEDIWVMYELAVSALATWAAA